MNEIKSMLIIDKSTQGIVGKVEFDKAVGWKIITQNKLLVDVLKDCVSRWRILSNTENGPVFTEKGAVTLANMLEEIWNNRLKKPEVRKGLSKELSREKDLIYEISMRIEVCSPG